MCRARCLAGDKKSSRHPSHPKLFSSSEAALLLVSILAADQMERSLWWREWPQRVLSAEVSRKICAILLFEFEKIVFKIVVELMSRRMKNLLTSSNMWCANMQCFRCPTEKSTNRQIDRRWCSFLFTSLFLRLSLHLTDQRSFNNSYLTSMV